MKETKKQSANKDEASCCSGMENTKLYMAALFLVGIVLGALIGYGYLSNQKSTDGASFGINSSTVKNTTADATALEKAVLFINNELLAQQGISAKVDKVEDLNARIVYISLFAGNTKLQTGSVYLLNNSVLVLSGYNIATYSSQPNNVTYTSPQIVKTDKPDAKLFVMSFCPFGNEAETALKPVVDLLGQNASIEPHFVLYPQYKGGSENYCMGNGSYCSMHGIDELKEDVRQMCIWKYNKEKWWQYVSYLNTNCNLNNVNTCWQIAANATGVNTTKISECESNEALTLLVAEQALNVEYAAKAGRPSLGSPMFFVNSVEYAGPRTSEGYKTGICESFNSAPSACSTVLSSESSGIATGECG